MCQVPKPPDGLVKETQSFPIGVHAGGKGEAATVCMDFTRHFPWEHVTAPDTFCMYVCTCRCVHVYECVWVGECASVCACVWRSESMSGVLLSSSPPYPLSQSLSLTLQLTHRFTSLAAQQAVEIVLCLPLQSITKSTIYMASMPGFLHGCWVPTLGSPACKASTY